MQIISEARDHTIARHWPHAHIAYRCTGTQQCTAVQRWLHRIHVPADESTHLDCARRSPAHSDTHTRRHGTFTHAAPKRSSPQRRKRSAPMPAAHPHSTGTATAHPPCLRPRPLDVEALARASEARSGRHPSGGYTKTKPRARERSARACGTSLHCPDAQLTEPTVDHCAIANHCAHCGTPRCQPYAQVKCLKAEMPVVTSSASQPSLTHCVPFAPSDGVGHAEATACWAVML